MSSDKYRSKLEVLTAKLLKDQGIKFKYEAENVDYRSRVRSGICECGSKDVYQRRKYLPDFKLAERFYVESKGKLTSSERTKFLSIRDSNPGIRIVFVFGADNKLSKSSAKRYSDWCGVHGFEYGIKALPASIGDPGAASVSDGS